MLIIKNAYSTGIFWQYVTDITAENNNRICCLKISWYYKLHKYNKYATCNEL